MILVALLFGVAFGSMDHHMAKMTDLCTECEQIIGTIHLVLANNETEGAVLNALHQFCTFLPSEFQTPCGDAVTHYGSEMIDALVKYLADPSQLCTMLGLCKGKQAQKQREAYVNFRHLLNVYSSKGVEVFQTPKSLEGMSECSLCEFFMDLVQSTLSDKPMQDFANTEALNLCSLLEPVKAEGCKLLVETMEPEIYLTIVKRYLNPMTFCTGIAVCGKN
jgi:hypothetical protein